MVYKILLLVALIALVYAIYNPRESIQKAEIVVVPASSYRSPAALHEEDAAAANLQMRLNLLERQQCFATHRFTSECVR